VHRNAFADDPGRPMRKDSRGSTVSRTGRDLEAYVISRRTILRGATGVAAVTPLALALDAFAVDGAPPPADEASGTAAVPAVEGAPVPETLANKRSDLASGTSVPDAAFPLTHLGLSWVGSAAAARLRTRSGWGEWREVAGCSAGTDDAPVDGTGVVAAPGAVGYEVQVAGNGSATAVELNVLDGPTRAVAAPAGELNLFAGPAPRRRGELPGMPIYLSRAAWGANEEYRYNPDGTLDTPPAFYPVQTLTVHHTGFDDDQPDPAATIRAIYFNQAVTLDWGDVGYQLFVDAEGRVYEGVYSDPDPIPVFGPDLGADGRPQMVNGSHVGLFNAGNIGVVLIGDFTNRLPTPAARRSLTAVLALLAGVCRLNPTGTTQYVNPVVPDRTATIATICGHRDWNTANPIAGATQCPGNLFYPQLPALRRDVARLMRIFGLPGG
jgi:hypothetical protein